MTFVNQSFPQAANSPASHEAAETAKSMGEEVRDFAGDVGRMAGNLITVTSGNLSGRSNASAARISGFERFVRRLRLSLKRLPRLWPDAD